MKKLLLLSLLVLLGCSKDDGDFFDRVNGKIFIITQTPNAGFINKEEIRNAFKIREEFYDNIVNNDLTGVFTKYIKAWEDGACGADYLYRPEQYEGEWEFTDITSDYVRLEMGIPTRMIMEARIIRTNPMVISVEVNNSGESMWEEISREEFQTMLDRWDCNSLPRFL